MIYENNRYYVEPVSSLFEEPVGVEMYGLINKETKVREAEISLLPQAIQLANQLNDALDELLAEEEVEVVLEEASALYSH